MWRRKLELSSGHWIEKAFVSVPGILDGCTLRTSDGLCKVASSGVATGTGTLVSSLCPFRKALMGDETPIKPPE